MTNIKVRDLTDTSSITSNNQLMVLTDDANNVVKNITVGDFNLNIISTDANNGITQGTDGNLYVDNANSGVTAGTYQYPQSVTVNNKGKITNIISGTSGSSRNIGEIIASTIPLTDAGLHLLDGALISGSGSYADFVTYIADLYDSGDYTDIFETEANWQTAVTTYGVCGKFVYDSINNTVRLPKITGFIEGASGTTTLGDVTEAGLPNITGTFGAGGSSDARDNQYSGAFSKVYNIDSKTGDAASGWEQYCARVSFDASRSSSIYSNSNTVQPQSVKVLYYIVIATSTKTAIEVDIDEIATDLNGKADIDLTNTLPASTFIDKVSSWTMPDYTTGITRTWNTVYQAQDNVIVTWYVSGGGQNGQYAELYVGTTSNPDIKIDAGGNDQASYHEGGWVIVPKGYYYKATGAGNYSRTLKEYSMKGAN